MGSDTEYTKATILELKIVKRVADEVFEVTGKEELVEIAM
jgi:hypothetical protein